MKNLGMVLKELRKSKHLTQKELSEGVCAQSMLSAIENDVYVPNANLLINLSKKLGVDLDEISLSTNFEISSQEEFNETVEKLCNEHQYTELKAFLLQDDVINDLKTSQQIQSYYYYLGVSQLQTNSIFSAIQSLKLSLAEASGTRLSTLSRLAYAAISYVYALQGQKESAADNLDLVFNNWDEYNYDENQNILYYSAALIYFKMNDYQSSTAYLVDGISFITKHDSHYMLANCYFLLARLSKVAHNDNERVEANKRKDLFTELYGEKVFENF